MLSVQRVELICPTGTLRKILSSPLCKNISLHPSGKSSLQIRAIPPHKRGVSRSSRTRGGMRWTRQRFARDGIAGQVERLVSGQQRADERCCSVRRSRVVLTPRRWRQVRGVKSAQPGLDKTYPRMTVATSPVTGESTKETVKTIACGNVGGFRGTRILVCVLPLPSAHEAAGATGIRRSPRPLLGGRSINASGASRREDEVV